MQDSNSTMQDSNSQLVPKIIQEVRKTSVENYYLLQSDFCDTLDLVIKKHTERLFIQSDCLLVQNKVLLGLILQLRDDNQQNLAHLKVLHDYQQIKQMEEQDKKDF